MSGSARQTIMRDGIFLTGVILLAGYAAAPPAHAGDSRPQTDSILLYQSGTVVAVPEAETRGQPKIHPLTIRLLDERPEREPLKAWVLFTDKGHGNERAARTALADTASRYGARAIERRSRRRTLPGLVDYHDLPVSPAYIDAIKATGAHVHVASKWVNGASVLATRDQIDRIATLPFVRTIQPVRRGRNVEPVQVQATPVDRIQTTPAARSPATPLDYGESEGELSQINLISVHDQGYTGAGVVIGILDTGFRTEHVAFNEPGHSLNIVAAWDFINDDSGVGPQPGDPPFQYNHGTYILGTLAAYKPGELVGGAFDASYILCKTEDTSDEYEAEEDNFVAGIEFIEAHGGDVATSSLGYVEWYSQSQLDGMTAVTTIAVNIATANGLHFCTAAGNDGHDGNPATSNLIAPADALQVITCGAVQGGGLIASFSSDGPSADGRVKPELLARGSGTSTVDPGDTTAYITVNGTSLSTPLVAGAVACLAGAHPDWTVDQMRSYLFHTAGDYVANGTFDPVFVRGYGIVDAFAAFQGDCNLNGISDADEISSGAGPDCNLNGLPDDCDLDYGTSPDCNDNLMPDECEVPITQSFFSGELSPIGKDFPQSYTAESSPPAIDEVTLTFTGFAELLGGTTESITVDINGTQLGTIFVDNAGDCSDPPDVDELTLSALVFNDIVNGGDAVIGMLPTTQWVNPWQCLPNPTFITVTLSYKAEGLVPDCNNTGIPDECETGDLDGDARVTLSDFGDYLSCLTGPCDQPPCEPAMYADRCCVAADADHDGDHDLADVAAFLAKFTGP